MIVKDANGEDIEVFTAEEVETKNKEALDAHIAANPDRTDDIAKLEKERDDAIKVAEEAAKAGGDKTNIKNLRDAAEKSTAAVEKIKTELLGEIEKVKSSGLNEYKTDLLDVYSKGDVDLKKKMEVHLANFKSSPATKAEMKEQIINAYKLSSDKPAPDFMSGMSGGGDRGVVSANPAGTIEESANGKLMRQSVFGISDADAKKYGGVK